jgi:hypothetical protein
MLEWRRVLYGFSNKGRAGTKALLRASICPRPNSLFKAVFSLYKIKYTRKIDDYKEDVTAARWPAQKHSDNRREQFHGLEIIIFFRIFFFARGLTLPAVPRVFTEKKKKKKEEKKKLWELAGFERWSDSTIDGCSIDSATKITLKKEALFTHILIKNV